MNTDAFLKELLETGTASLFDPNPIRFTRDHEPGIRPIKKIVKDGTAHQELRRELTRNQFLRGCLAATEKESVEHLLVGLGDHEGSTTYISSVLHAVGGPSSVSIPAIVNTAIQGWMLGEHFAEVIVFHNHPWNTLNVLFDNTPLASTTDRQTLLANLLKPEYAIKALIGGGRVRFFLGENGQVREFKTPNLVGFLKQHLSTVKP
ncbi:MAG: hypothetical protein Q8K67_05515 [Geothrix sp.]|nr:hypothetical protein [Geothrix sp.]